MNAKILIPAILVGFLVFSKNKSKSTGTSQNTTTDDSGTDQTDQTDQNDQNSEQDNQNKPAKNPTYNTLTTVRKKILDDYLEGMPIITSELGPLNDYIEWAKIQTANNIKPLYQNYLANQAYWNISTAEGKTDVFTDLGGINPPGFDGTMPYLLQKGKKATLNKGGPWIDIFEFGESQSDANKRLGKGIALWTDIKKYITNNIDLEKCPQGVVCE